MPELALGTQERPLRVAIVGSGPSAFYAADALLKAEDRVVYVDVFERLPTPFGLVRGGVAPDHQKIKTVAAGYERTASHPRFRFFGNVMLGRDIQVEDLVAHYDQIVYAVGNESDRRMNVPGEDLKGVHSATEFVGWYNGHPDFRDREFDLARARRVALIGNGNVAMDVARILIKRPDDLADTDIADHALEALRESGVREVLLLGRRGPAQAAFSPKEIQEVANVEGADLVVPAHEVELDPVSAEWLEKDAPASAKKNLEILRGCVENGEGKNERKVRVMFKVSPVEILGEGGRVSKIRLEHSELVFDDKGVPRPKGTGRFSEHDVDLVFKAIGYRGVPIPGVPFHDRWGVIPNAEGRVLRDADSDEVIPGQYVVGWAKRGPTGLIGTNNADSKETVKRMLEDIAGRTAPPLPSDFERAVPAMLKDRGVDYVSYEDWKRLDRFEIAEGEKRGKVRHKLTSVEEMMRKIRELRDQG